MHTWALIGLVCLKSTSLAAQGLSGPLHFYGLWEGFHPVELILDENGEGTLILPDEPFPIQLSARQQGDRWKIHEVIPDGSLSGTWVIGPQSDHWLGEWSNYNQTSGSLCALFSAPVDVPKTFNLRFFFKDGKKKWSFILFPLPRGKWKGLAWESTQAKLTNVTGEWLAKGILLSLDDPQSGQRYELNLLTDRQAWRSATWSDQLGRSQRVHLRNFKTDPVGVTAFLDFSREVLLLRPELEWPAWNEFLNLHIKLAQKSFDEQYYNLMKGQDHPAPHFRHAVRLYSWVDWSYRDRKVVSGTLFIASSWAPTRRIPFTCHKKSGMITQKQIWPDGQIPEGLADRLGALTNDLPIRIDPLFVHFGSAESEIIVPIKELTPLIPPRTPLCDAFDR